MISYAPFWRTLEKQGVSTYALINKHGISAATLAHMRRGDGISTAKINDFCQILHCGVCDVIEYIPDRSSEPSEK